jgi:hypothetical protein
MEWVMVGPEPLIVRVEFDETESFKKALTVANEATTKLYSDYPGVVIGEPEKVEKFGAEAFSEFVVPIVQHIDALMGIVLGYWLTRRRLTIVVGDVEIRDVQMNDLPRVIDQIKRLKKV